MANLKEIRGRIASVTSTRQITSAMKMVAAAKLRKAQSFAAQIVPYKNKMQEILSLLDETLKENTDNVFIQKREIKTVLAVAVSSNKGLCGGFNGNIFKQCAALRDNNPGLDIQYYAIGKKISEQLSKGGFKVFKSRNEAIDKVEYAVCAEIVQEITDLFLEKKFDCIKLVYNEFVNPAVQNVSETDFLPLNFKAEKSKFKSDYIFEPDKETIITSLIPQWLKTVLFSALAESFAGEQGARMTAMNKATDNATELIKDLNLQYNKVRQASITNEIIEIVSGANAH
ncbi:MAG: ATP synthase F1 subunit gamma [Bacteroidales bacterium]|nr:ATP synthase F1 subunit gamma [Bacteroidales bacterium]